MSVLVVGGLVAAWLAFVFTRSLAVSGCVLRTSATKRAFLYVVVSGMDVRFDFKAELCLCPLSVFVFVYMFLLCQSDGREFETKNILKYLGIIWSGDIGDFGLPCRVPGERSPPRTPNNGIEL